MVRMLVIIAATALGAASPFAGAAASADTLVPGGWLQPIQLPKPPPPSAAAGPTAAAPEPAPVERRPIVRSRVKVHRPAAPSAEEPASDGKIHF
jgi:hypothetical protein